MSTIRDFILKEELALDGFKFQHVEDVLAYGTSEGTQKAWDTRGRGRNKPQSKPQLRQGIKPSKKIVQWAKTGYEALKSDDVTIKKIESQSGKKQIALKHAWFAKKLGDYTQSFEGLTDFVKICVKVFEKLVKASVGIGGASEVAHALHYAAVHLGPVVAHLTSAAGTLHLI